MHILKDERGMAVIEPLISAEAIASRVRELALSIESDFAGRSPLLVAVLLGAFVFASDLIRHMQQPHELSGVVVSSYASGTRRAPRPRLLADTRAGIAGRDVILLEDIVDTGHTMHVLIGRLTKRAPASITVATLLDKPSARQVEVPLRYVGFQVPPAFVVGYGLDWNGLYRNLPYIGALSPSAPSAPPARTQA